MTTPIEIYVREIPDEYRPLVEQVLVNYVANGGHLSDSQGISTSGSVIQHAQTVNARFDHWLQTHRLVTT